jgi:opine dehydrogenase
MTGTAFEAFATAVAVQGRRSPPTVESPSRVTILGGGADGLLLAALCLSEDAEVTLFSAYGSELDELRKAGGVAIRGAGPVGFYQVDRAGTPAIRATGELDSAVRAAQAIFLTGPTHKQRTYAMALADHLRDGQTLILAPGRTLGAAEAAWLLRVGGSTADFTILEAQGLPYWIAAKGAQLTLSAAAPVAAATLPAGRDDVLKGLGRYLPNLTPKLSTVHSGFWDGSGLVEAPALLLGGVAAGEGGPAVPTGGVALAENANFRTLIGPGQRAVIARLALERRRVAARFGVRDLPDDETWIAAHAGAARGEGARPRPDRGAALHLLRCAAIGSLSPLVSAARAADEPTPATEAIITLASTVLGADIAPAGRRLDAIGVNAGNLDEARRILDSIAGSGRHG